MIDKHPALIARAAHTSDVVAAVNFARDRSLPLAIRAGGHNIAGNALVDDGLVIDLSQMKAARVDAGARRVVIEAGALLADLDAATQAHGLAVPLGINSTTGVAGLTLGGGFGWLSRKHGLTIDNLESAEVVTAKGEVVRASAGENPDLFWALRGGGGNFGVVTRLCLRLHGIDQVVGGMLVLPASADVISGLVAAADVAPDDLSIIAKVMKAPPLPFIPREQHGKLVVMARMVYAGEPATGEKAIAPRRALATPLADLVRPMRYPAMYAGPDPPGPAFSIGTNLLLDNLSKRGAETILVHIETATSQVPVVEVRVLGGAIARIADGATAFRHRRAKVMVAL